MEGRREEGREGGREGVREGERGRERRLRKARGREGRNTVVMRQVEYLYLCYTHMKMITHLQDAW